MASENEVAYCSDAPDADEKRLWNGVQVQRVLDNEVRYKDWRFIVRQQNIDGYLGPQDIVLMLRAEWMGADAATGKEERQQSRWWVLSPWMCKTEVIQTAFLCVMKAEEHELREAFKYLTGVVPWQKWAAPFNSHIDINVLARDADQVDVRTDNRPEAPKNQRRE